MREWFKENISAKVIGSIGKKLIDPKFSKPAIFIGGCARSGTTLLLSIVSACPSVLAIPDETDAFTKWKKGKGTIHPVRIDRFYRKFMKLTIQKSKTRWAEKRPDNVLYIGEILSYFGADARFIHIIRDPRDVCCSLHPKDPTKYWVEPKRWISAVSAGLKFIDNPQVLTLHYEDLILVNERSIRRICEFIDEPYSEEMKNWKTNASVRESNAWHQPLSSNCSNSIGNWKKEENNERLKHLLQNQALVKLMTELGYN